jgi:tetratricopeptide (TPR) repeat protein
MLLLGLVLELIAGEGWERLKSRLRPDDPAWADEMAQRLAAVSGFDLSGSQVRGIARWLERGEVFAVLAQADVDNPEPALRSLVAALSYEMGDPGPQARDMAAALTAIAIEELVNIAEPGLAATLVSHRTIARGIQDLKDGQAAIYGRIGDVLAALQTSNALPSEQLQSLTPPGRRLMSQLHSSNPSLTSALMPWVLGTPLEQSANMASLVDRTPDWLAGALSRHAWEIVAEVAAHSGASAHSSLANERAASLDPRERTRLLAKAALAAKDAGDRPRSEALVAQAIDGSIGAEAEFAHVVRRLIESDTGAGTAFAEACESAITAGAQELALLYTWAGNAHFIDGDTDEAIAVLRRASAALPDYAGPRISLAAVLLARAVESPDSERLTNLHEALEVALRARDLRREWGGDTSEALAVATQAAFSLGDWALVIDLGSSLPPGGSPAVTDARRLVALAHAMQGSSLVPTPGSAFEQAFFHAISLAGDPEKNGEASEAFREAGSLAENVAELTAALFGSANLGVRELEGIDRVRAHDEDLAGTLQALTILRHGETNEAVALLRPLASRNRLASRVLADAYIVSDRVADAIAVLKEAAIAFGDVEMATEACALLADVGEFDEAERFALSQLTSTPPGDGARQLRRVLLKIAVQRNDPREVERAARQALAGGDTDEAVWWTRVEALYRLGQFKEAWRVLTQQPLHSPSSERAAKLFLQVQARADSGGFDAVLELMDRFESSHDVIVTALVLFFTMDRQSSVDDAQLAHFHEHVEQFIARYPDSHLIRRATVTPDDPDELRAQIRELMAPDAVRDRARTALAERAAAGHVPIGFAANALGRRYIDVLLTPSSIPFRAVTADPAVLRAERDLALSCLDGPVVLDLSAAVFGSHIQRYWPRLLGAFSRLYFVEAEFQEVDVASILRLPVGYLHWDHETDTFRMTEVTDDDTELVKDRLSWVRARVGELTSYSGDVGSALSSLGDAAEGAWASALGAALTLDVPLVCDDVALAALARTLGARAFGSYAALMALRDSADITAEEFEEIDRTLFLAHADDLPLSPSDFAQLGEDLDAPLSARLHPLSRPAFWSTAEGFQSFRRIVGALPSSDPDALPSTVHAAILGVMRSRLAGSGERLVGALFVAAILDSHATPDVAVRIVEAARHACRSTGATDPLSAIVDEVVRSVAEVFGEPAAARFATYIFGGLEESDRHAVTERVLTLRS